MLSEYKGEFQHRFRSKCYRHIFLSLPRKKNPEVIPFTLIPRPKLDKTTCGQPAYAKLSTVVYSKRTHDWLIKNEITGNEVGLAL